MADSSARRGGGHGGFTLVELLVVIGIIALLTAILLPTLSRAREQADRAACLSNLRQVHQSFHLYALDHRDLVPLGYRLGLKQFNSMIYSGTARRFVLFGLLRQAGLMPQPRAFYCPSEVDPRSMFNTPENPWPPGAEGDPGINVAGGYGARPEVNLPDAPAAGPAVFPRLSKFRSRAIFADLTAMPLRLDTRHRRGINVLHGDGSAVWVDRRLFDGDLATVTGVGPQHNDAQDRIWSTLDRR